MNTLSDWAGSGGTGGHADGTWVTWVTCNHARPQVTQKKVSCLTLKQEHQEKKDAGKQKQGAKNELILAPLHVHRLPTLT